PAARPAVHPSPTRRSSDLLKKEELRNVDGSDSLHPSRSGDVVVVARPPYQFDAATPGQTIAFSQFFGQHGYLPNLVELVRRTSQDRKSTRLNSSHQIISYA